MILKNYLFSLKFSLLYAVGDFWVLREKNFENAAVLCDRIFALAREGCAGQDDLSVSVVRVMNAK